MINRRLHYFLLFLILVAALFTCCTDKKYDGRSESDLIKEEKTLDSLIRIARLLPDDAKQEKFVSLYYQAKLIMKRIPDSSAVKARAILFAMNKLGKVGGFNEAIRMGWKAINISTKANIDDPGSYRVQVFGTLAGLYRSIGKEDSTLIIYKISVSDAALFNNRISLATSLNNVGIFFQSNGELDSALVYFHSADSLVNTLDEKVSSVRLLQGNIKGNIASVFFDRGEYLKAKHLFTESYNLCKGINEDYSMINAGISLAKTELELGNYDKAKSLFELCQEQLDSSGVYHSNKVRNQLYLLEVKQEYFEKIGDMTNALNIAKQILSLSESTRNFNQNNQIFTSGLLARYSSSMFESALKNEKKLLDNEKQQDRMRFWILLLIAMGLTITPTIMLFYYRQNARLHQERNKLIESNHLITQQKLKLEQNEKLLLDLELENKKKDLTNMAIHLSKKQEWATELDKRIKLIESLRGNKRFREFSALKNEIRNHLNIDREKSLIIDNIDSLNSAFYEKINKHYPTLSRTEMKLFSLIKLKMSNAQIAQLQNINPDSVRMSRLRLRRKLKLSPEQDLNSFVQNF